ncbi:MAG: polysaccharide biosynthesis protein CapD [Pseudomonadota bacterium]
MTSASTTVWTRIDAFLSRLRPYREPLSLLLDCTMVAFCWNVTYLFRLGFERWISARPAYDGWVLLGVIGVYAAAFTFFRVPQGMWRFSSFGDVKRLTWACLAAGAISAAIVLTLQLQQVPRAVLALHPWVALMGVCVMRIGYRMLYEHARAQMSGGSSEVRRTLVLGAGEAGRRLLAGIHHQGWVVLGLLDDDLSKRGARIAGVPVWGPLSLLNQPATLEGITHLIVALPSMRGPRRREVLEMAAKTGLQVLTVPSAQELREGRDLNRVRDIEPEDLLGREPVSLDEVGIGDVLRAKVVLITGAGGSIGSELCRQVARYEPACLVLYEQSEFNLYAIEQELSLSCPALRLECVMGDVKDLDHLQDTFSQLRPQVVFHAAAYKHVPLMEQRNAAAALRNNALGTYRAALAAAQAQVERFVLISTDKAVNPTNVMGATKRAAEMVVSSLALQHPRTRFMAVRFGNVLGSSGSVIPKFKEQIARGGPVTVTHPEIIRYFMTIPEAARLVLQAAAIGQSGQVLVLDMGEPVKIVDLARQLIRLSGHAPDEIPIEFTGLRPGEKLYEELLADADSTLATPYEQVRLARLTDNGHAVHELLQWIEQHPLADEQAVRDRLVQVIPEYRPAR